MNLLRLLEEERQRKTLKNENSLPPFSLTNDRYDQSTYWGRVQHFREVTDWRTLFTTDKELNSALELLAKYKTGEVKNDSAETNSRLWNARKLKDSIVHPDTGEKIPLLLRFSAFAPTNVPLCAGLLLPSASLFSTLFWQWLNQSYNVAVNFANRNASNNISNQQLLVAYSSAVITSCGIAVGLGQVVKKLGNLKSRAIATMFRATIPFIAVSSAGALNVFVIRQNELREGIEVRDRNGVSFGKSRQAGIMALSECAFTRVVWCVPLLLFPPMIMSQLGKLSLLKKSRAARFCSELGVISLCLFQTVPLAIGIFPQTREVDPKRLEPSFRNLKDSKGQTVSTLFYNKGL